MSASGMRNRVRLLEGGSKGQSSTEPARWRGSHIPSARPPGTGELGPVPGRVSAGEAVLGEGYLSPGTRVLIVRGQPGHRTPWEVRGGEGRGAASSLGAPRSHSPRGATPRASRGGETVQEFTWAGSGPPRVALLTAAPGDQCTGPPGSRNFRDHSRSGAQGDSSEAS